MEFVRKLLNRARRFSLFDFAMFKLVLLSAGIILGTYLHWFFRPGMWIVWTIFGVSFVYMTLVMFFSREKTN